MISEENLSYPSTKQAVNKTGHIHTEKYTFNMTHRFESD